VLHFQMAGTSVEFVYAGLGNDVQTFVTDVPDAGNHDVIRFESTQFTIFDVFVNSGAIRSPEPTSSSRWKRPADHQVGPRCAFL
jgi:hypothetical protein